jgi:hypothetical protein
MGQSDITDRLPSSIDGSYMGVRHSCEDDVLVGATRIKFDAESNFTLPWRDLNLE